MEKTYKIRNKTLCVLLALLALVCLCFGLVSCKKNDITLSFDDGAEISINIGDKKMLSFSSSSELSASNKAEIVSSDETVVTTDAKGYITAVGKGTAEVTLKVSGIDSTAKIRINVAIPNIKAENRYYINVDRAKYTSVLAELDDAVAAETSVYLEAYQGDKLVGLTTSLSQPNHRVYFSLDELNLKNGIYRIGIACIANDSAKINRVFLTDSVASYSLLKSEKMTLSNVEIKADGQIGLIDENIGYGSVIFTVSIDKNEDGSLVNPKIFIRAESGALWAVKFRRGDGYDSTTEVTVLSDCDVDSNNSCIVDLTKYSNYVRDGQITLYIYTIGGDLQIGDIINYTGDYLFDSAVTESEYTPLQSVNITVPAKLYVGNEYSVKFSYLPNNATFKDVIIVTSNDNVTLLDSGRIKVNKAGECELSCVGTDGTIYGNILLNGLVKVKQISFDTTAGCATVSLSAANYDLTKITSIYPAEASDKSISYKITSSTSNGASVDVNGVVKFSSIGTIVISLTSKDNTDAKETFTLTVVDSLNPVTNIKIAQSETEMDVGESLVLSASVMPENATDKTIIWKSDNEDIATCENGTVNALKAGIVTIGVFSKDGAAYDKITLLVHAVKTITINPENAKYGCIELGSEILTGDKVTVKVYFGNKEYNIAKDIEIAEAEKDVQTIGSMVVQRRIFFALENSIFSTEGQYKFEVFVTRNGEALQAYSFGTISCYADNPLTANNWNDGYNCSATVSGDNVSKATLNADGYGFVSLRIAVSELKQARYLIVNIPDGTSTKISIKIGANDYALTKGDCTTYGVYKFDLIDYLTTLTNEEYVDLKLYLIGDRGSTATIGQIISVSEIL